MNNSTAPSRQKTRQAPAEFPQFKEWQPYIPPPSIGQQHLANLRKIGRDGQRHTTQFSLGTCGGNHSSRD